MACVCVCGGGGGGGGGGGVGYQLSWKRRGLIIDGYTNSVGMLNNSIHYRQWIQMVNTGSGQSAIDQKC